MSASKFIRCLSIIALAFFSVNPPAMAIDVAGLKLADSTKVANHELQLNGAGVRFKAVFKVYVAGLYLGEKKATAAAVLSSTGPKRVTLVTLRDVSSNELSNGFLSSIRENIDKNERASLMMSMYKLGEVFSLLPELAQGTVLNIDMIPDVGLKISVNGKKISEPIGDMAFCNAILKIWIGDKPVDSKLKQALLGQKNEEIARNY